MYIEVNFGLAPAYVLLDFKAHALNSVERQCGHLDHYAPYFQLCGFKSSLVSYYLIQSWIKFIFTFFLSVLPPVMTV